MQAEQTKTHKISWLIGGIVVVGLVVLGYFASQQTELFRASLTQPGLASNENEPLYIPDNYEATSPQAQNTIDVKVGTVGLGDEWVATISTTIRFNPTKIEFAGDPLDFTQSPPGFSGHVFSSSATLNSVDANTSELDIVIVLDGNSYQFSAGDTVFSLMLMVKSGMTEGNEILITPTSLDLGVQTNGAGPAFTSSTYTSISPGKIKIAKRACSTAEEPNSDWNCDSWDTSPGACDASSFENRTCTLIGDCDPGDNNENRPATQRACTCQEWVCTDWDACTEETQSRTCPEADALPAGCVVRASTPALPPVTQDCGLLLGDVTGLILSLHETTVNNLTAEQKAEAFAAAVILVNSPAAAGVGLDIEEESITLGFTGDDADLDIDKIANIADNLADDINALTNNVTATANTRLPSGTEDLPGLVLIYPTAADANGMVDIEQTFQAGNVSILPFPVNGLTLKREDTFPMQVIAKFLDGSTLLLTAGQVVWVNDTQNRLSDIDLDAGQLKAGDASGFSTVYATVTAEGDMGAGQIEKSSNPLTVNVPSGPIIESAEIVGAGDIERGSQIELSVKVSDFHTIEDIQYILTKIREPDTNTTFDIAEFTLAETQEGEEADPDNPDVSLNYRIYKILVEVPMDANLMDGNYDLVIEITDTANYVAVKTIPIYIGAALWGDVNSDGSFNMGDVIRAFEISANPAGATAREKAAADVIQNGTVNLADVKTLFDALQ